jgi:alpha-tubulin suppressor-like RCC1 family protein
VSIGGQLGDGTTTSRLTPSAFDVLCGVQAITAGTDHTCALMTTGGVRCWGDNMRRQLGTTGAEQLTPPIFDMLWCVQAIAAGSFHTCALMTTGSVRCWGLDDQGQLGLARPDYRKPTPVAGLCR